MGRLNKRTSSYQYIDSHYNHKIVPWQFYLYNENPIPGKTTFILRQVTLLQCSTTSLLGLQLYKHVGPAGRQLLYLLCCAGRLATVNWYWYNTILLKNRPNIELKSSPFLDWEVYRDIFWSLHCVNWSNIGNANLPIIVMMIRTIIMFCRLFTWMFPHTNYRNKNQYE